MPSRFIESGVRQTKNAPALIALCETWLTDNDQKDFTALMAIRQS